MTKKKLQKALDEKGIKVKILHVEKTKFNDYWVVFTYDLSYEGRISYKDVETITTPEEDALVEDMEDAITEIEYNALKEGEK